MFEQKTFDLSNYFCFNNYHADQMSYFSGTKRRLKAQPSDDEPLEKRKFEEISDELTNFTINSPEPKIQELDLDENIIDEDLPTTSAEFDETLEPFVEEPEDGGQIVLSDELQMYLNRMKREKLLPVRQQNNQLVLYNPADSIRSRIVEITDADDNSNEEDHLNQPTVESVATSPEHNEDDEMFDVEEAEERMDID